MHFVDWDFRRTSSLALPLDPAGFLRIPDSLFESGVRRVMAARWVARALEGGASERHAEEECLLASEVSSNF